MRLRIIYGNPIRYEVDGQEVSEELYLAATEGKFEERLAEMLATGATPNCISDQTYMRGHTNGAQFEKCQHMGNYYRHITEENGGNTNGKRYLSGLARFPGDPEAWVTGRDDIRRVVESRPGWNCQGTVNVDGSSTAPPPSPPVEVADDLLNKYTIQVASGLPDPEHIDLADLKQQVKERIKPQKYKKAAASEVVV